MKRSDIERLLPQTLRRTAAQGTPLSALLEVMEGLHGSADDTLARLHHFFSPHVAPAAFVPLLATWVDLDWLWQIEGTSRSESHQPVSVSNLSCGLGRVRDLVASAAFLSRWRGTPRGLCMFLQLATGIEGFSINESISGPAGRPLPYHFGVNAPKEAAVHKDLIERILQHEKPAYTTFELSIEGPELDARDHDHPRRGAEHG